MNLGQQVEKRNQRRSFVCLLTYLWNSAFSLKLHFSFNRDDNVAFYKRTFIPWKREIKQRECCRVCQKIYSSVEHKHKIEEIDSLTCITRITYLKSEIMVSSVYLHLSDLTVKISFKLLVELLILDYPFFGMMFCKIKL